MHRVEHAQSFGHMDSMMQMDINSNFVGMKNFKFAFFFGTTSWVPRKM
jgi:hypothetical protein